MIEIIQSPLTRHVVERYALDETVFIQDWIDERIGEDRRPVPLWKIYVNGKELPPYFNASVKPEDRCEIVIEPKSDPVTWIYVIVSVLSFAYALTIDTSVPITGAGESAPKGDSIYDSNIRANRPRLNGFVPEVFGTMPRYFDYLTMPYKYYSGNKLRKTRALLSVGKGRYEQGQMFIGDTAVENFGSAYSDEWFEPGADVSGNPAYENWRTNRDVQNVRLTREFDPGAYTDHECDLSGFVVTTKLSGVPVGTAAAEGDKFTIDSGVNEGYYEITGVGGTDGSELTVIKLRLAGGGFNYRFEEDDGWSGFSAETDVLLSFPVGNSEAGWFGPYPMQRPGEQSLAGEIDFFLPGLGDYTPQGDIESRSLSVQIQWRPIGATDDYWIDGTTTFTDATPDEIGFTYELTGNTPLIDISGFTASRELILTAKGMRYVLRLVGLSATDWDSVGDKSIVNISGITGIEGSQAYQVQSKSGATIDLLAEGELSVSDDWDGYGVIASGNITQIMVEREVRVRRLTAESEKSNELDTIYIERLKGRVPTVTSYEGITCVAVEVQGGEEISEASTNKINGYITRILPVWDGSTFSGEQATNDIAPVIAYLIQNVGYNLDDINLTNLGELDAIWKSRGETFSAEISDEITLFDALKMVLAVGFSEPLIKNGQLYPFRTGIKENYDFMYTPDQIIGDVEVAGSLASGGSDGYLVEWMNVAAKKTDYQLCTFGEQTGANPTKIKAVGITDPVKAWRFGMRLARENHYSPGTITWKTSLQGFNSSPGELTAVCANLTGGTTHGTVRGLSGNTLTLDQNIAFGAGTHYIAVRRPDGTTFGPVTATAGAQPNEVDIPLPLDFTPVFNLTQHRPSFSFGDAVSWAIPCIVKDIKLAGKDTVQIVAKEYIQEIYANDGGFDENAANDDGYLENDSLAQEQFIDLTDDDFWTASGYSDSESRWVSNFGFMPDFYPQAGAPHSSTVGFTRIEFDMLHDQANSMQYNLQVILRDSDGNPHGIDFFSSDETLAQSTVSTLSVSIPVDTYVEYIRINRSSGTGGPVYITQIRFFY